MLNKETYDIAFRKLTERVTEYDIVLNDSFFEALDDVEIRRGSVDVHIEIESHTAGYNLRISIEGDVYVACDRCLDDMEQWVEGESEFLIKYGNTEEQDDDYVINLSEETGVLNIQWLIYEVIALNVPMFHSHDEGECNQEMIEQLSRYITHEYVDDEQGEDNENEENANQHTDPRWDGLKNIIKN